MIPTESSTSSVYTNPFCRRLFLPVFIVLPSFLPVFRRSNACIAIRLPHRLSFLFLMLLVFSAVFAAMALSFLVLYLPRSATPHAFFLLQISLSYPFLMFLFLLWLLPSSLSLL